MTMAGLSRVLESPEQLGSSRAGNTKPEAQSIESFRNQKVERCFRSKLQRFGKLFPCY